VLLAADQITRYLKEMITGGPSRWGTSQSGLERCLDPWKEDIEQLDLYDQVNESKDITFYRSLVEKNPASYTPDLARQLGNLGIRLSNLNRHEESLGTTQESITLYHSLPKSCLV